MVLSLAISISQLSDLRFAGRVLQDQLERTDTGSQSSLADIISSSTIALLESPSGLWQSTFFHFSLTDCHDKDLQLTKG